MVMTMISLGTYLYSVERCVLMAQPQKETAPVLTSMPALTPHGTVFTKPKFYRYVHFRLP